MPEAVLAVYKDHNGTRELLTLDGAALPVRLMPIDEVLRVCPFFSSYEFSSAPTLRLWTDDNSSYVGVVYDGGLEGMVSLLDHDEPDPSPIFRSLDSFVVHMLNAVRRSSTSVEVQEIPRELPVHVDSADTLVADTALFLEFRHRYENATDVSKRAEAARLALCFIPVANMDRVVPFLFDDDWNTGERAARLIGVREWEAGIPFLGKLVETGRVNALSAACHVLQQWRRRSPSAVAECVRLDSVLTGERRGVWDSVKSWLPIVVRR